MNILFPSGITRDKKITPAPLFDALAVGCALALHSISPEYNIEHNNLGALPNTHRLIVDETFRNNTTGDSNSKKKIVDRINFARDEILTEINNAKSPSASK